MEMAIKNGRVEKEFYEKILTTTTTRLGRSVFALMADEEKDHYEGLKELNNELEKSGKLPDPLPDKFRQTSVQNILKELVGKTAGAPTISEIEWENLGKSLTLEEKVVAFYERLQEKASDPAVRALFASFIRIEREHCRFLKDAREFVARAGYIG
jgi:rubrerythrin